jgi:hypothetical protein
MKPRYIVEITNIYPRPFRVIDTRTGEILLQTSQKSVADNFAAEYERTWRERPTLRGRLRKLFSKLTARRSKSNERTTS